MHRFARAAAFAFAPLAGLVVVVAASGWLYVVQPPHGFPGPSIADALPLDELSRRSAVPLPSSWPPGRAPGSRSG